MNQQLQAPMELFTDQWYCGSPPACPAALRPEISATSHQKQKRICNMTWQKYSGPYTEDISFNSDDSEQCHCLKILSLSYKLPRHSTVCTNRQKGEMDISSASGPHSLDITFELAESRLESTGGGGSVFNCVCLSSPTPPPAALQAQPTTLKWDLTILFHKISKTNTSWLSRFYWMLNMSSSFISEKGESCYPAREFMLILVYFI